MGHPVAECVLPAPHYRIEHARIVTATGVIEDGSVTIANGRIVEVGEPSAEAVE